MCSWGSLLADFSSALEPDSDTLPFRFVSFSFPPAVFAPQPDRVAIVTGGTDGIGYATASRLARLGMTVIVGEARGTEAARGDPCGYAQGSVVLHERPLCIVFCVRRPGDRHTATGSS